MMDIVLVEKFCKDNGLFETEKDDKSNPETPAFRFFSPHHPVKGSVSIDHDVISVTFLNKDFQNVLEKKMPSSRFISLVQEPSHHWEIASIEESGVFWSTVYQTIMDAPAGNFKLPEQKKPQSFIDKLLNGPDFEDEGEDWKVSDFNPQDDEGKETETLQQKKVRRGQEIYRKRQGKLWNGACAVTGIKNPLLLRASHAKPWKDCTSGKERLDPYNGFLLNVALDALFDKDLISFDDKGQILLSTLLETDTLAKLGIHGQMKLRFIYPEHLPYLQIQRERFEHRKNLLLKEKLSTD